MTERKIQQERAKFALDMTIPVKSFLAMMDENNSEIFGDIPEFYSTIKDSESNVTAELNQFKEGGLVSIFGDPGFGKTIQLRQFTHKLISKQINSNQFNFIPIFVKAKSLAKVIKSIPDEKQKIPMKNVPFNPFSKDAAIERNRRRGAPPRVIPDPEEMPFNPFAIKEAKHVRARLREARENGDFEDLSYLRKQSSSLNLTCKKSSYPICLITCDCNGKGSISLLMLMMKSFQKMIEFLLLNLSEKELKANIVKP